MSRLNTTDKGRVRREQRILINRRIKFLSGSGYLSQNGFSLIAVMIASAIGVVVIGTISSFLIDMQKTTNSLKFRADADTFNEELRALLSSEQSCTNSFSPLAGNSSATHNILVLRDGASAVKYSIGAEYGDRSLILNRMTLNSFVVGSAANKGDMILTSALGTSKSATGPQLVVRAIRITVELDGSGNISSCLALSKMSDGIWQRSPANINDIGFVAPTTGGKVGIGMTNPVATLDVNGAIRAGSSVTVTTCGLGAANGEGSQRYNYTTHLMEYCDGTVWNPIGGGSSPPGTMCGVSRMDVVALITPCMGLDPRFACPPGYVRQMVGWRAGGMFYCAKL